MHHLFYSLNYVNGNHCKEELYRTCIILTISANEKFWYHLIYYCSLLFKNNLQGVTIKEKTRLSMIEDALDLMGLWCHYYVLKIFYYKQQKLLKHFIYFCNIWCNKKNNFCWNMEIAIHHLTYLTFAIACSPGPWKSAIVFDATQMILLQI